MSKPVIKVQFNISCMGLKNKDLLSKSDPQVIAYMKAASKPGIPKDRLPWIEVGRTEMVKDCLDPSFTRPIVVDYYFEEVQHIKFCVFDVDKEGGTLDEQDFLGEITTTVASVAATGRTINLPLNKRDGKPGNCGQMRVVATELKESDMAVIISLSGRELDKKDFFGKSDPYFEIHRQERDGTYAMVYRSKPIMKTLNPDWPAFELNQGVLIGNTNNLETPLLFRVYDFDEGSAHDLIGEVQSNLKDISSRPSFQLPITNPKKAKKGKTSGTLVVNSIKFEKIYSFLDYIAGGTHMNLVVAIDYTASNGNPKEPSSLHYFNPSQQQLNQYEKAIFANGTILEYYDTDKKFPVYGFGAKFADGRVSHCFAVNGNEQNPEVQGVQGILDVYRHSMKYVTLYGPTNFAPTIRQTSALVRHVEKSSPLGSNYFVLLILTDGEITDMQETIDAIVDASDLCLSIVIVGVGEADFSKMDMLDGDGQLLMASNGRRAVRDIVQFVPFRNFNYGGNFDGDALAKEVLAEIPGQLLACMRKRGVKPNPPTVYQC